MYCCSHRRHFIHIGYTLTDEGQILPCSPTPSTAHCDALKIASVSIVNVRGMTVPAAMILYQAPDVAMLWEILILSSLQALAVVCKGSWSIRECILFPTI